MTTPINSFQDILDAMERDPALRDALRRYILTDEILALPAQVKALTDAVEALVSESSELRAGQEQLRAEVGELRTGQEQIRADVREIRADVADLRAGQEQRRKDVTQLSDDVAELRAGQEELRAGVSELRTDVGRMGGDVSNMMGTDYEGTAARIADRLVRRRLGLTSPTVVMRGRGMNATPTLPEVDQAAALGTITWEESDDLALADVIVRATGEDGSFVYVLAEISITVQERDRVRAHRRAALMEKATGVPTIPVVIGIDEESPVGNSGVAFWQFDPDE